MHTWLLRPRRRGFFGQRVHVGAIGRTYLSLYFQICLISYQDHRELVSVFYPKDLSLEFVDFFEAVEEDTHRRGVRWPFLIQSGEITRGEMQKERRVAAKFD